MSVSSSAQLQQLQTKRAELEQAIKGLRERGTTIDKELKEKQQELSRTMSMISNLQHEPILTDHAILRYLERTGQVDVEQIRQKIMTNRTKEVINFVINGTIPICDGLKAKIKNKTIVTIINPEKKDK